MSNPIHEIGIRWVEGLPQAEIICMHLYELRALAMCPDSSFGKKCLDYVRDGCTWSNPLDKQDYEAIIRVVFDRDLKNFVGKRKKPTRVTVGIPRSMTRLEMTTALFHVLGYQVCKWHLKNALSSKEYWLIFQTLSRNFEVEWFLLTDFQHATMSPVARAAATSNSLANGAAAAAAAAGKERACVGVKDVYEGMTTVYLYRRTTLPGT